MKLIKPDENYKNQISEYRQEFINVNSSMDGCGSLFRMEDPEEWLQQVKSLANIETVPSNFVQSTQFIYIRETDNKLVGMIQVRHYFNDFLEKYGGHIGYSVRPSERKKGYASLMLKECLQYCKLIGLNRVLLTCEENNTGSKKTILKNGGIYEKTVFCERDSVNLERYWIELQNLLTKIA